MILEQGHRTEKLGNNNTSIKETQIPGNGAWILERDSSERLLLRGPIAEKEKKKSPVFKSLQKILCEIFFPPKNKEG